MAGDCPLPGIAGYSAAKAALHNYTQWLAAMNGLHTGGSNHRVNCVAFGFALGDQNRAMLVNGDGSWKPRGGAIASMHPAGTWGEAQDIVAPIAMLLNPISGVGMNGAVMKVDRGFSSMGLPRYGSNSVAVSST